MATWLRADGTADVLTLPAGDAAALAAFQRAVGGYIEVVATRYQLRNGEPLIVVVNESGLLGGLPHNVIASVIAGQYIAGDAVLCTRAELEPPEHEPDA